MEVRFTVGSYYNWTEHVLIEIVFAIKNSSKKVKSVTIGMCVNATLDLTGCVIKIVETQGEETHLLVHLWDVLQGPLAGI